MTLFSTEQILQLAAWLLALTEFIVGLYVLLLNVRHTANRHASAFLMLLALNAFALGLMYGATDTAQATWSTAIMAAASPASGPWLLILAVVLLKPDWPRSPWYRRWVWRLLYGLAFLPAVLTLVDLALGTRSWYTGLQTYTGGFAPLSEYAAGSLSGPIKVMDIYAMPVITIFPLLYIALRDPQVTPMTRRLARLLLGVQLAIILIQFGLRSALSGGIPTLITAAIFALAYAYASFQQMISERRLQRGRLQTRLTALILVIMLPLLVAVTTLVNRSAATLIEQDALDRLQTTNKSLKTNVELWLDLNTRALRQLTTQPGIVSMDPAQQKPLLRTMQAAFPDMYLISTTDLNGFNVARSDDVAPKDYATRIWFSGAKAGASAAYQTVIGQTSGKPALVEGMPIRDNSGNIVGVGMFASELSSIADQVRASRVGNTGSVFVIDDQDLVVVHSDPTFPTAELKSLGSYPPVVALRNGTREWVPFKDESNKQWRAYVDVLPNGWGVIVQQPEAELLSSLRLFQVISWTTLAVGTVLLLILVWLTIRQTLRPIGSLTDTVTAIARGDLTRTAPVESQDEIGDLAQTFNTMTVQLRELIGGLEQRVAERTRDLELRSNYLGAAAEVGRATSSILETDRLINQVVELIRDQFKLYYVGLFLVDESQNEAVLRSGTGTGTARDAGRVMLARGHRLRIGGGSMVGWSIANALPRIASDVGADAVRLATPELPDTRSEVAIPLRSRGRVLGALTVQSDQPAAFDETAIAALEIMADQVATAIENARLFAESQAALDTTRRVYGDMSRQAWQNLIGDRPELRQAYRSDELGVTVAGGVWQPEMEQAVRTGQIVQAERTSDKGDQAARHLLAVPLKVRGSVIGVLDTYKLGEAGQWTPEEIALVETLAEQLDLALESARLYQDTQRRAAREQLASTITARMRESLDMERVLKTAADELFQALELDHIAIRLAPEEAVSDELPKGDEHVDLA